MDILDFGYCIESPVFSGGECDALLGMLEKSTRTGRAGTRLGVPGVPFRATLFAKSGAANWLIPWHQDTALPLVSAFTDRDWVSWSRKEGIRYAHAPAWALSRVVALRVHLDASSGENGPLRVVPGSHQAGVLTDQELSDYVKTNDHNACLVPRGGVLTMRPLLIYSSSKAQTEAPRRVLHIEYADTLDLKPGVRLAVA
jgi:ectoine hydroxylase-related dioxygenase (phytanoyl-CoA dioxygenase family)